MVFVRKRRDVGARRDDAMPGMIFVFGPARSTSAWSASIVPWTRTAVVDVDAGIAVVRNTSPMEHIGVAKRM